MDYYAKQQRLITTFDIDLNLQNYNTQKWKSILNLPPIALNQEEISRKFVKTLLLQDCSFNLYPGMNYLQQNNPDQWIQNNVYPSNIQAPERIYVFADDGGANLTIYGQTRCCLGVMQREQHFLPFNGQQGDTYKKISWVLSNAKPITIKTNQNQISYGLYVYNYVTKDFDIIVNNQTKCGARLNTQSQVLTMDTFQLSFGDVTGNIEAAYGNVEPIDLDFLITMVDTDQL